MQLCHYKNWSFGGHKKVIKAFQYKMDVCGTVMTEKFLTHLGEYFDVVH
jgi:hypothetical protein